MNEDCKTILEILARHRVGVRPVFARALGKDPGNTLQLLRKRLIVTRKLFGQLNYHQLSKEGCSYCGVSEWHSRSPGPQATLMYIGLLWICFMQDADRRLLTEMEFTELFGNSLSGHHLMETVDGKPKVYRVLVSPQATNKSILRSIRLHTAQAIKIEAVRDAIADRDFGIMVGVPTEWQRAALQRAVAKEQQNIAIKVVIAPSLMTLQEAISEVSHRED
jgi:hypothetical protein